MKRTMLTALVWILCGLGLFGSAQAGPPNLVIILTDDQGYADVGFNGCTDIPTPHIDSIAAGRFRYRCRKA